MLQVYNVLDRVGRKEDTNEHDEYAVDTHRAGAIGQASHANACALFES